MSIMFDVLLKNGRIVDGKNNPSYFSDIAISDGKIVAIQKNISGDARHVIDAEGLTVCPGFIDVHSHNDLMPFMEDRKKSLKLMQGVTTELVGQCGLGIIPCTEGKGNLWKDYVRGVVGSPDIKWEFPDLNTYFDRIGNAGYKNNIAAMISHGAVKASVMGFESRLPSEDEIKKMCSIVENAMKQGAFGLTMGLQYMPGIFSENHEIVELFKVVKKYDGIIMVHLRNHDSTITDAMNYIIEAAEAAEVKIHISHLRSYASDVYGKNADCLISKIEEAYSRGVDITFDEHMYLSGSTLMTQLLPPWVMEAGKGSLKDALKDESIIKRLKAELKDENVHYRGWDNYSAVNGWKGIMITSVKNENNIKYIGRCVEEIAREENMEPVDFALKLLSEEKGAGIVTLNVFSEEDTIKLIKHPLEMMGSDSIPAGVPHPRLYGNYPLLFGKYVREKDALSLEEAVYKSSGFPAKRLGLNNIGEIAVGKKADIILFDADTIKGYEDYTNPSLPPEGIIHVILGGHIAVLNSKVTSGEYGRTVTRQ